MMEQRRSGIAIAIISSLALILLAAECRFGKSQNQETDWLIATMSHYTPAATRRRLIIRETMHKPFAAEATFRFILGRPNTEAESNRIMIENNTYGDIVLLNWIDESPTTANRIKPLEFLTSILPTGSNAHLRRKFISKTDDDSYIHIPLYKSTFIHPYMNTSRVVIGRNCTGCQTWLYPAGQLYTLSLDMSDHLANLHKTIQLVPTQEEDSRIGLLLAKNNEFPPENYTFVHVGNREAFDWNPNVQHTWAKNHKVMEGAVNPHKLKKDFDFLLVASLFGANGVMSERLNEVDQNTGRRR